MLRAGKWMVVACLAACGPALAGSGLSCRIQQDLVAGERKAPKVTDFVWSTAHHSAEPTGPIKTRLGTLHYTSGQRQTEWGPMPRDTLTLNGRPIAAPPEVNGTIGFGKAFDYGDRIALAYLGEREGDSGATPSEVVLLLDEAGAIVETDIQPGNAELDPNHCTLIE